MALDVAYQDQRARHQDRVLVFGLFMINLLLLFLPGTWNKRFFALFAALYAYVVASEFGLVPMFAYFI